ncbi:MAG: transglutaminase domain-containing protein [Deltaproteobacteria bacterium]|nr:transglutaminase domain-containing protein [Deltaproteobacteria bacterium]
MQALAESLGGDALAIYQYVRQQMRSELYYGVRKGALGALRSMAGNDADLSALLVALLRASDFPARYRYATVRLTPAQLMQMAGTEDVRCTRERRAWRSTCSSRRTCWTCRSTRWCSTARTVRRTRQRRSGRGWS